MAVPATARVMHSSTAAALQEKPLAQIVPFAGRRKPLEEQISGRTNAQVISFPSINSPKEQSSVRPSAQVIAFPAQDMKPRRKSNDAEICQGIKIESAREAKAKGQFTRKSEEALNINYQLAWIVWRAFVSIMQSMGIRASESLRRVEIHEPMKRAA